MATAAASRMDGRTKLILAAEKLFARGGIEGVSLREIAAAAGQGNHHAVQYHFRSREGLVQAVFDYRMWQMEDRRGEMLKAAKSAGKLDDARTIMEVIFLPQLDLPGSTAITAMRISCANIFCVPKPRSSPTSDRNCRPI